MVSEPLCDAFVWASMKQIDIELRIMIRAWIFGQMPNKYFLSQLHAVWYLSVSDDADSESGVFILPHYACFGNFGKNVPIWPLFRFFRHILPILCVSVYFDL